MELLIAKMDDIKIFGSKTFQQTKFISSCLLDVSSSFLSAKLQTVSLDTFSPN